MRSKGRSERPRSFLDDLTANDPLLVALLHQAVLDANAGDSAAINFLERFAPERVKFTESTKGAGIS